MKKFWQFFFMIFHYRRLLGIALVAAVVDAACKAAGAGLISTIVKLFFGDTEREDSRNLQLMVAEKLRPYEQYADLSGIVAYVPTDPWQGLTVVLGIILVLAVIGSIGRFIHESVTFTVSLRTVMRIRKMVFYRLVHLPMDFAARQSTSEQASRVFRDTSVLSRGFSALTGKAISGVLGGIAFLGVAFYQNWKLSLMFIIVVPPIAVLIRKFGRKIRKASKKALKQSGLMLGAVTEALQGLRVVKVHHTEGYERRRFNTINRVMLQQQLTVRTVRALSSPIIETLSLVGLVVVILMAAWTVLRPDGPGPSTMVGVLGALMLAGNSFRQLSGLNNALNEAAAAAENIDQTLHWPVESAPGSLEERRRTRLPRHQVSVSFEHVTFTYPQSSAPALCDVTFTIPHGATCAVVGANGSGKSTLLGLLPRLYQPDSGRILVDGVDIAGCSLRSVRRQIAMVTQETVLFDGTVAQNIAYGSRHVSPERLREAARRAHADDFIAKLPQGYDTQIGERGQRLSGGQRQRLAIARAILRDPAILILDEATSQIDADSEAQIGAALAEFAAGRTTFIIAHRLSTVINADVIAVMSDGRLVALGRHEELLRTSDVYRMLCRTQLHGAEPVTA